MRNIFTFMLLPLLTCYSFSQENLYVGSGLNFYVNDLVSVIGDATIVDATKFYSNTSANILCKSNFSVTTGTVTNLGKFVFTNTVEKAIRGNVVSSKFDLTTGSNIEFVTGVNSLSVGDSLYMRGGNIRTGTNLLTIGSSATNPGILSYTSGYVNGSIKRWFATSTVSNVLFPFGGTGYYSPGKLSFTAAPTTGGSLTSTHYIASPGVVSVSLVDAGIPVVNLSPINLWEFNATDALAGGTYSISLTTDSIQGVNDVSILRVAKRTLSTSPWQLDGTHVAGTGSVNTPTANRSGITGFSQFAIASPSANPLPVTLVYFNANCGGDGIDLKWQTASESNSDYFSLERSTDGAVWNSIAKLACAENSNQLVNYGFTDKDRFVGTRYYRLKQVDKDGKKVDYDAVSTNCNSEDAFTLSVFPNPTVDDFTIKIISKEGGVCSAKIMTSEGKLVGEQVVSIEPGVTQLPVSLAGRATGVYLVEISVGVTKTIQRIILQ